MEWHTRHCHLTIEAIDTQLDILGHRYSRANQRLHLPSGQFSHLQLPV